PPVHAAGVPHGQADVPPVGRPAPAAGAAEGVRSGPDRRSAAVPAVRPAAPALPHEQHRPQPGAGAVTALQPPPAPPPPAVARKLCGVTRHDMTMDAFRSRAAKLKAMSLGELATRTSYAAFLAFER